MVTNEEIEAGRTAKGGFTRATMASWGVSWPPPHGWRDALLKGEPVPPAGTVKPKPPSAGDGSEPDHKALLHQVVMAVINAGQSDILKGIDDLNAYYNGRIPTVADIVGARPQTAIITGGIEWDDKVYSFSVARRVV